VSFGSSEESYLQQRATRWLIRIIAVSTTASAIALAVMVYPTREDPAPTLAPTVPSTCTITPSPSRTSTPTSPPTPANTPTPHATATATSTATPTCAPGRVETNTYNSQVTQTDELYSIYLPPCYDQSTARYPVLYLLHGWPFDNNHWDTLGADEAAERGIQSGTLPPFIMVLPRGRERLYVGTSGGDFSFEAQVMRDLIPHIDETYRTVASREGRAIGGMSRGGVWSLEIAMMHPDLFSAVGAHSPALSANLAPPPYDPFYLLSHSGVATLRFYLDYGDADWTRQSTLALHEALDDRNIPNVCTQHVGGHNNELWSRNVAEYLLFYTADWFQLGQ